MNYDPLRELIKRIKSGSLEELAVLYNGLAEFQSYEGLTTLIEEAVDTGVQYRSEETPDLMTLKYNPSYWFASKEDRNLMCKLLRNIQGDPDLFIDYSQAVQCNEDDCIPLHRGLDALLALCFLNKIDYSLVFDEYLPGWEYSYWVHKPADIDLFHLAEPKPAAYSIDRNQIHLVYIFTNDFTECSDGLTYGRRIILNHQEKNAVIKHIPNGRLATIHREIESSSEYKKKDDPHNRMLLLSRLINDQSGIQLSGNPQRIEQIRFSKMMPGVSIFQAACVEVYSMFEAITRNPENEDTPLLEKVISIIRPQVNEALHLYNKNKMSEIKKEINRECH